MSQILLEMAKDLVLAQIQVHRLSPEDMHAVLQDIYKSLLALHAQEVSNGMGAVETPETPPTPSNWRKSITKQTVTCLECGASFKQLSVRHLRAHGLDTRSYRVKYGIPPRQPLSARGDRPTETDRAAVETVGEGADVSEGARANEASAEARDIESEEVVEEAQERWGAAEFARCL